VRSWAWVGVPWVLVWRPATVVTSPCQTSRPTPLTGKLGGKLVIYTTNDENLINAVIPAFAREAWLVAVSVTAGRVGHVLRHASQREGLSRRRRHVGSSYHGLPGTRICSRPMLPRRTRDVPEEWRKYERVLHAVHASKAL